MNLKILRSYSVIILGTLITAFGLNQFLIPNRLNDGGITGIAVVIHYLLGWQVGWVLLLLNVPLFLLTAALIGIHFGTKTIVGTLSLSVALMVVPETPLTHDLLLSSIYGGLFSGIGLGFAFRAGGSTGGTDLVARLLRRFVHTSMGTGLLMTDAFVIAITGLSFGPTSAMFSLFALFVGTRMVDLVGAGWDYQRAAYIISKESDRIVEAIYTEIGRGVTGLSGIGKFTRQPNEVLFVVVARSEVPRLKILVYQIDPLAFMVITPAHEVLGEGFQSGETAARY